MKTEEPKKEIRCAVYTRKSTSEGLEKEFTSLDNQRESGENYIQSQKGQGWILLPQSYDDGGFTGANTDRPALKQLLEDIKAGKIDCVVVYKVDRLSRSLLDFVNLLQFFDEHKVAFVSVTQHFNTNTSMGRLTLNILLSFAQFEREIISERTKDKMGAARKKGRWTGGRPPLGYDLDKENHRLVVNPKEAETIRMIFELYIQEKSLLRVAQILSEKGFRTKPYNHKGKQTGLARIKNTNIQYFIKSWLYVGKVSYEGQIYQGLHEPIISEELFHEANEILKNNRRERGSSRNIKSLGLLKGLLRCKHCDVAMCHTYAKKGAVKYLYYVCLNAVKRNRSHCPTKSVSANRIEDLVLALLRQWCREPRLDENTWEKLTQLEKVDLVASLVKGADYSAKEGVLGVLLHNDDQRREISVALSELKNPHFLKKEEIKNEPKLRQRLALAHQIEGLLDTGKISELKQLTGHLNMSEVRLNQIVNMTLLSPRIQEEILLSDNKIIARIPEYKINELIREADWQKQAASWQTLLSEYPA